MAATLNPFSLRALGFAAGYLIREPRKFWPRLALKVRQIANGGAYPALAPGAVRFIQRELLMRSKPIVGEWGCGRSTLWLAGRCSKLISVESDDTWFELISREINRRGMKNVTLLRREGADYVQALASTGVKNFDVIIIDGVQRAQCAAVACTVLKPGGLIVLDNSNRPEYAAFIPMLGKAIVVFKGHATQTSVFRA